MSAPEVKSSMAAASLSDLSLRLLANVVSYLKTSDHLTMLHVSRASRAAARSPLAWHKLVAFEELSAHPLFRGVRWQRPADGVATSRLDWLNCRPPRVTIQEPSCRYFAAGVAPSLRELRVVSSSPEITQVCVS
jgi:hypothetical protein